MDTLESTALLRCFCDCQDLSLKFEGMHACTRYIHWSHPNLPCLYYYSYAVHALLRMYVCMYAFVYVSMVLYNYSSWMYECVLSVLKLKYLGLPGITTSGWIEISSQVISDALSITWGPVAPLLIKRKHPLRLRLCHLSPKKGVCLGIFIKGIFKSIHGLVLRSIHHFFSSYSIIFLRAYMD